VAEADETFRVNLGNGINATLGKASGTSTISDKPQSTLYLPLLRR
jgi:hypothetical protein